MLAVAPEDPAAWNNLGNVTGKQGDWPGAAEGRAPPGRNATCEARGGLLCEAQGGVGALSPKTYMGGG